MPLRERGRSYPQTEILDLLRESPGLKPAEIARRLNRTPGSVRRLLFTMFQSGKVDQPFSHGGYYVPSEEERP